MISKKDLRIGLALMGLFVAFYWATFGGHTYSPDEEMLYYVTEGIVERRSFVVPEATETTSLSTGARGVDGNNYAITGLLQSILAIPLYLVGRTVSHAFDPILRPFWTRFFVSLFNGIVGGMIVGLMYIVSRKLGFRRGTSLFLAIGLGATTFLGVYARTFFSESLVTFWILLAVYGAYSYRLNPQAKWAILWGMALGLSVATKPQALLAWPAFGVYALLILFVDHTDQQARLRWFSRSLGYGLLGVLLPVALVVIYNQVRFGGFLDTGYPSIPGYINRGPTIRGLYGYIFSPGRSFFLYAPLCILSVFGTKYFYLRHKLESVLFILLVTVYLLFYASLPHFTGGSWGPRYLSHIVPMALLPAGAYIETYPIKRVWRYCLATSLLMLGFVVQLGTVVVNYNTYYNLDLGKYSLHRFGWDAIIFHPSYTPIIGHWKLWMQRHQQWREHRLEQVGLEEGHYALHGDFYEIEDQNLAPFGFWTYDEMTVRFHVESVGHAELIVTYWRPPDEGVPQFPLVYSINGIRLGAEPSITEIEGIAWHADRVSVPVNHGNKPVEVRIEAPLWSPVVALNVADSRMLGVFLAKIEVVADGHSLTSNVVRRPFIPTLSSVLEVYDWGNHATTWFWYPLYPHFVDCWWWYLGYIGESRQTVQLVRWAGGLAIGSIAALSTAMLLGIFPSKFQKCFTSLSRSLQRFRSMGSDVQSH